MILKIRVLGVKLKEKWRNLPLNLRITYTTTTLLVIGMSIMSTITYIVISGKMNDELLKRKITIRNHGEAAFLNPALIRKNDEELLTDTTNDLKSTLLVFMVITFISISIIGAVVSYIVQKRSVQQIKEGLLKLKTFVSDASHELRTPLSVLVGYTELHKIKMKNTANTPLEERIEDANQTIEKIHNNAKRMEALVNDLLVVAKLDNHEKLIHKHFNLIPVISGIFEELNFLYPKRCIKINAIEQEVIVFGNESQISRAFTNLAQNIYKYTPEGSPTEVAISTIGNRVKIEFIDHGAGLTEEDMKIMFNRFWTKDKGRSRDNAGTGLGLSIVKEIVEQNNGIVYAAQTPGGGLTQTIILNSNLKSK
ncbi:MAG: HAMP domain-containing histidine kinase [Candidatus Ancillula sp.]|jgi:signal transduction histidine kinase|nr:HAMP domain-containing histidine kinase [Candidatus Ancillula sp.]